MLDNPQSKLNQQAQQDTSSLNNQTSQPAPIDSQPDGSRLKPNMKPDLAKPATQTFTNGEEQVTTPEGGNGFWAKLKGKLADGASDRLNAKQGTQPPTTSQPDTKASHPNAPSTTQPKVASPQLPQSPKPNPSFSAPTIPKAHMPKIPKLR